MTVKEKFPKLCQGIGKKSGSVGDTIMRATRVAELSGCVLLNFL